MRRRAFLACAAVGVAGCLTGDPTTATPSGTGDAGSATSDADAVSEGDDTTTDGAATAADEGSEGAGASPTPTTTPTPTRTRSPRPPALAGYDTTEVGVSTPDGERLGRVRTAVSDTQKLRIRGLSDVAHLPADWGMLFVYDTVGSHTYVMREMDFGIDIVYADAEGVITAIHHAPEPGPDEDGSRQRYPGTGQFVLEVSYEWTSERGVDPGDVLRFEL